MNELDEMLERNGQGQGFPGGKGFKFSPAVLLGKAFRTQQFAVSLVPQLVIRESQMKFFTLITDDADVYIGHAEVTTSSGLILPAGFAVSFGVMENVSVFVVGAVGTETLHLLDMGLY